MKFFMLQDTTSGLWYRRGPRYAHNWVEQEKASVWTTRQGASAALGSIRCQRPAKRTPKIMVLDTEDRPEIVLVDGDDWEGLYVDGRLVEEGHHVQIEDLFRILGIEGKRIFPDVAWLQDRGSLPEKLEDVKCNS